MKLFLLTFGGQKSNLDIGCGSLRAGRLFIPYLKPGNYYGIEPERWLVEEGIKNEIGQDLIRIKKPSFFYADDYSFTSFGVQFDFLIAQSIFSHTPIGQIQACLDHASKCMHEGSILAATFVEGLEDYKGSEWVYPGKVSYKPKTIMKVVFNAGLVCVRTNWEHPSQTWYLIGKPENKTNLIKTKKILNRVSPFSFIGLHAMSVLKRFVLRLRP